MGQWWKGRVEEIWRGITNTKGPVKSYTEIYLFPKCMYIYKRSLNGINHIMGNNTPTRHYKLLNTTHSTRNGVHIF